MPGSNVYISSGGAAGVPPTTPTPPTTPPATKGGGPAASATGGFPVSAYLGAGLGLLQAFGTYNQNSQISDVSGYEDLYREFGNRDYAGDFNDLIQQRRSSYLGAVPSWTKIRLMNSPAKIGSAITSAGSGAMAGAGFGPWGIAIGGLVGLGASLLGSSAADTKAKQKEADLKLLREQALEDNWRNFLAGVKNAEQQTNFQAMSNIAAFGGPLGFPVMGAIDYEMAQRDLARKESQKKAFGGPLHTHGADWTNGITIIDSGGSHESNPFEGVPMGIAPDGTPNLVEEGEVVYNDYVFSNRIKVPKAIREKYKLRGQKEITFADAAKQAQKESEERPNDPISKRGLDDIMNKLMIEQELLRQRRSSKAANKFGDGGDKKKKKSDPLAMLRYMPALGGGMGVVTDFLGITNTPDYSHADALTETASSAVGAIPDVSFSPVGGYLTYKPFDTLFYSNQLGNQAAATRRAIRNNSNGNRASAIAGLLAADYNAQTQLGNLFRQAEEYNLGQRERVETFNRATNQFNSEGFLKASIANAENRKNRANILMAAAEKAAAMRQSADQTAGAARSANLTNLFDNLGNIGREAASRNMILSNPALYYSIDSNNNITYKNGYDTLSDAAKDEVNRHAAARTKTRVHEG